MFIIFSITHSQFQPWTVDHLLVCGKWSSWCDVDTDLILDHHNAMPQIAARYMPWSAIEKMWSATRHEDRKDGNGKDMKGGVNVHYQHQKSNIAFHLFWNLLKNIVSYHIILHCPIRILLKITFVNTYWGQIWKQTCDKNQPLPNNMFVKFPK